MTDLPLEPQAGTVRLLLSEAASRHLSAAGETCFVIVHRVMRCEEPGTAGRYAIHLLPVPLEVARAAEAVAMGKARAVRVKAPTSAPKPEALP